MKLDKSKSLDAALLVLRLAAGVIFVLHGYGKLFGAAPGMTAFTGMVAGLGFPLPGLFAYAAALSEFVGGIALILGLYTKYATIFLSIVMIVAFAGVKRLKLPMGDVDLALLSMVIALHFAGPGMHTLKKWMGGKSDPTCKMCGSGDSGHKH